MVDTEIEDCIALCKLAYVCVSQLQESQVRTQTQ